ncbi:MAG: hypothetical protein COU33_01110 [Candidatus Magasanikbacteria bacterium CG10_big_fil_rev_8_21_14_0_10_43_6]|uniref:Uncharacterized protein n=1 Tax=Candidatus Magasanikbacteria bacterium CG10_big_fil_rev_8_21_14_0_10_43_6 TaxID=1974650 RepID=A0A2M6W1Z4_9BACT|nr:MAG: hypothetical protein COU33_01110 [Candidatus Magasanikbacteria bacterium CG10_big_fil_rev_8_21_14_0_10_43_6]
MHQPKGELAMLMRDDLKILQAALKALEEKGGEVGCAATPVLWMLTDAGAIPWLIQQMEARGVITRELLIGTGVAGVEDVLDKAAAEPIDPRHTA